MNSITNFRSHLGILGYHTPPPPAQTRRGQAGRRWAGTSEYLSARLLPSVVANSRKDSETPFSLLCPRNLLHSQVKVTGPIRHALIEGLAPKIQEVSAYVHFTVT